MHSFGAKEWADKCEQLEATIADLQGPFKTAQAERDEQGQLKARLNRDYNLLQNEHLKLHEKVKQEAAYTKQVEIERDALHERVAQLDGELACQKVETNGANERAQIVYQNYRETMDKFTDLQADHATLLGLVQALPRLGGEIFILTTQFRWQVRVRNAYGSDLFLAEFSSQRLAEAFMALLTYRAGLPAQPAQPEQGGV